MATLFSMLFAITMKHDTTHGLFQMGMEEQRLKHIHQSKK